MNRNSFLLNEWKSQTKQENELVNLKESSQSQQYSASSTITSADGSDLSQISKSLGILSANPKNQTESNSMIFIVSLSLSIQNYIGNNDDFDNFRFFSTRFILR